MPHTTRTAFHSALAAEDEHIPIEVARSKPYGMPEHYTSVTSTCFFFPADGFFLAPLALAMNLPFDLPLAGRGLALAPPGLKRPAPLFPLIFLCRQAKITFEGRGRCSFQILWLVPPAAGSDFGNNLGWFSL